MEELKSCHQCRKKIKTRMAICKNLKKEKSCVLKFCQRCLLNRYGENIDEAEQHNNWKCPKCRGNCNCSICMKRKGKEPIGKLARTVEDKGYSSVSNLLSVKALGTGKEEDSTPSKKDIPNLPREGQENACSKIGKDKRKTKKTKPKWCWSFSSLRPFLTKKNEMTTEGMEEKETTNEGMEAKRVKLNPEKI